MTALQPPGQLRTHRTIATGALAATFIAAAALSNWVINNIGRNNGAAAPHTFPIGWGLQAPSGVVLIGIMLTVRDALHERIGQRHTLYLIAASSLVSLTVAPRGLALASGATLLAAETADAVIYGRLRRHGKLKAAALSNIVSSIVDSALFLLIAYGAQAARTGTITLSIGKFEASLITLAVLALVARSRPSPRRDARSHRKLHCARSSEI